MSSEKNEHYNVGTLVTDPNFPEDGVGIIVRVTPEGREHFYKSDEVYRVHSFVSGHGIWLDKEYVEDICDVIYSTGKTAYLPN